MFFICNGLGYAEGPNGNNLRCDAQRSAARIALTVQKGARIAQKRCSPWSIRTDCRWPVWWCHSSAYVGSWSSHTHGESSPFLSFYHSHLACWNLNNNHWLLKPSTQLSCVRDQCPATEYYFIRITSAVFDAIYHHPLLIWVSRPLRFFSLARITLTLKSQPTHADSVYTSGILLHPKAGESLMKSFARSCACAFSFRTLCLT